MSGPRCAPFPHGLHARKMLKPCVSNQWGPIRRLENLTSNPEFPTGILRWVPSAWQTELVENYPTSLEISDFDQRRMSTLRKSSAYDGGRRAIGTFRVGHRAVFTLTSVPRRAAIFPPQVHSIRRYTYTHVYNSTSCNNPSSLPSFAKSGLVRAIYALSA